MNHKWNIPRILYLLAVLGAALLTIFLTQKTFFWVLGPVVVDYWAFAAGIFLISEGFWRISSSQEDKFILQFLRLLRIVIGVCIFTIHLLQFVRDGKLGG